MLFFKGGITFGECQQLKLTELLTLEAVMDYVNEQREKAQKAQATRARRRR